MCIYWKATLYTFTAATLSAVISKVTQRKLCLYKRKLKEDRKRVTHRSRKIVCSKAVTLS
jgi:hypothetical protein